MREYDDTYRDDPGDRDALEYMRAERSAEIHGEDIRTAFRENARADRIRMMRHYDRVRADRIAQGLSVENIPGPWAPELYE